MGHIEPTFIIDNEEINVKPNTNMLGSIVVFYIPISVFFYCLLFHRLNPDFFSNFISISFIGIVLYYVLRIVLVPRVFFEGNIPIADIKSVEIIDSQTFENSSRYWKNHFLSGFKPRSVSKIFLVHRYSKKTPVGFTPIDYSATVRVLREYGIDVVEND